MCSGVAESESASIVEAAHTVKDWRHMHEKLR